VSDIRLPGAREEERRAIAHVTVSYTYSVVYDLYRSISRRFVSR